MPPTLQPYFGKAYRSASGTPDSLTPRAEVDDLAGGGLSFYNRLDHPALKPGKFVEIDTSKLQRLVALLDSEPEGHITGRPQLLDEMEQWAATRGSGRIHPLTRELLDAITAIGKK